MLRKCLIVIPLLCCLFLSNCGFNDTASVDETNKSPWIIARDTFYLVLECVENSNAIGISSLFCDAVPVEASEIQEILDLINGEIIDVETKGLVDGVKVSEGGRYTLYTYAASFIIYTDIGNEYMVNIAGCTANDDNPNEIGIERFRIYDLQTDEMHYVGRT